MCCYVRVNPRWNRRVATFPTATFPSSVDVTEEAAAARGQARSNLRVSCSWSQVTILAQLNSSRSGSTQVLSNSAGSGP